MVRVGYLFSRAASIEKEKILSGGMENKRNKEGDKDKLYDNWSHLIDSPSTCFLRTRVSLIIITTTLLDRNLANTLLDSTTSQQTTVCLVILFPTSTECTECTPSTSVRTTSNGTTLKRNLRVLKLL
jgi:hypothetical protein